jgi:outer membrane receptor protein involved in Fe transport
VTVRASGFAAYSLSVNSSVHDLRIALKLPKDEQQVTVAARASTAEADTPESVTVVPERAIEDTGAVTLDDKLRQVAGFNLFRRASSRSSNPTTQGVSLRGTGASGASRAVVIADGVPLNDPFGGWVYWDRVPASAIDDVEVLRGGASHLYGSGAMGGVVAVHENTAPDEMTLDSAFGGFNTPYGSATTSKQIGPIVARLAAEGYRSNGYFIVRDQDRGAIDTPASLRYGTGSLRLSNAGTGRVRTFGELSLFNETRNNGTEQQRNDTRQYMLDGGVDVSGTRDTLQLRSYGGGQRFTQTFSAIAPDRNSESLTRWDRVPSQQLGGSALWHGSRGAHLVTAGFDARYVRGSADGLVFTTDSRNFVGGRQRTFGWFAQDRIALGTRVLLSAGGRLDRWTNFDAFNRTVSLVNGRTTVVSQDSRTDTAFSPQAALLVHATSKLSFNAATYRSFRAPTLQELYRGFRVGNVNTLANDQLRPELLTGAEGGAAYQFSRFTARATYFWNHIHDPVANVTIATTPAAITRQRQNLGATRARGVDLELESRVREWLFVNAGYEFVNSVVVRFPADPTLEGNRVPQVPRHQATFNINAQRSGWTGALQMRASGVAFDDDQNLLPLDRYATLDAYVSHTAFRSAEIYVAAENLLNQRYQVARTPIVTLGPPIQVRGGLRLHFGEPPAH